MQHPVYDQLGTPCQFPRHQQIARAGQEQDSIYSIQQGWAGRYTVLDSGQRQFTALYLPGDFCEPQWLIRPRSNEWIAALSPVRAVRMPIAELAASDLGLTEPGAMLSSMIQLLDRQASWIVSLGRKSAVERVCAVFAEVYDRTRAADRIGEHGFDMPLTQIELADVVGLTPIHVNRVLKDLRVRGVLEMRSRTVTVHDPEALRAIGAARVFV